MVVGTLALVVLFVLDLMTQFSLEFSQVDHLVAKGTVFIVSWIYKNVGMLGAEGKAITWF